MTTKYTRRTILRDAASGGVALALVLVIGVAPGVRWGLPQILWPRLSNDKG